MKPKKIVLVLVALVVCTCATPASQNEELLNKLDELLAAVQKAKPVTEIEAIIKEIPTIKVDHIDRVVWQKFVAINSALKSDGSTSNDHDVPRWTTKLNPKINEIFNNLLQRERVTEQANDPPTFRLEGDPATEPAPSLTTEELLDKLNGLETAIQKNKTATELALIFKDIRPNLAGHIDQAVFVKLGYVFSSILVDSKRCEFINYEPHWDYEWVLYKINKMFRGKMFETEITRIARFPNNDPLMTAVERKELLEKLNLVLATIKRDKALTGAPATTVFLRMPRMQVGQIDEVVLDSLIEIANATYTYSITSADLSVSIIERIKRKYNETYKLFIAIALKNKLFAKEPARPNDKLSVPQDVREGLPNKPNETVTAKLEYYAATESATKPNDKPAIKPEETTTKKPSGSATADEIQEIFATTLVITNTTIVIASVVLAAVIFAVLAICICIRKK
ncbi:hypothetical protein TKK_0009313 [Trichogramma kaykai]